MKYFLLSTGSAIAITLFSSQIAWGEVRKPAVVVTNSVLCNLTQQIAEDTIDLKCLVSPGTDPHTYQVRPSDRRDIETAALVLYGGYGFEENLIPLIRSSPNSVPKVVVYEAAVSDPIRGGHNHQHGSGEHSHSSGEADPHVFHSAENGVKIAKVIDQNLAKLNPSQAERYTKNTQKLSAELTQIHRWIREQVQTIPFKQRWLVTTHDAFEYYARTYNMGIAATLQGISTEEKPTAFRIAQLVQEVRAAEVPTIFAEVTVNPRLIQAVAKEAKVKISDRSLYADGVGEPGTEADSYQKMLIANTKTIVEGLGGRYVTFQPEKPSATAKLGS